jgi:L,D-peptidoglycan transpeptidase YkuD (ErfK/YbiS/YcfS/YnhG family)
MISHVGQSMLAVVVVATVASVGAAPARADDRLVVVLGDDHEGWRATRGSLARLVRDGGAWRVDGAPIRVWLGAAGLGWGRGEHDDRAWRGAAPAGPTKREGDRRTPAGLFSVGEVTGYAAAPPSGATLPYWQADPSLRCVDDPESAAYNTLAAEPSDGRAPWRSAEVMRRDDVLYTWTVFVKHNAPPQKGAGSCIFLHVDGGAPTVGCVAMAEPEVRALVSWLRPATRVLILPSAAYTRLRSGGRLSALGSLPSASALTARGSGG